VSAWQFGDLVQLILSPGVFLLFLTRLRDIMLIVFVAILDACSFGLISDKFLDTKATGHHRFHLIGHFGLFISVQFSKVFSIIFRGLEFPLGCVPLFRSDVGA